MKKGGKKLDDKGSMRRLPADYEHPYKSGQDPATDAWYTAFFIENHLDYYAYPGYVATPEQVRFMVYTEENERYYPCSDRMFWTIMRRENSSFLREKYEEVLQEHTEMQIIGPSQEKFLRRQEYGIGKMYDRRLDEIYAI